MFQRDPQMFHGDPQMFHGTLEESAEAVKCFTEPLNTPRSL